MKKILIYGDSNTWGDNFLEGRRIPDDKQWPNILQNKLGNNYKILQEGLPGRLAGDDEENKIYKNGKSTFISTFRTNAPVDILIISLGTNDMQIKYDKTSEKIIEDLLWYKDAIRQLYSDPEDKIKYFKNEELPEIIYILPVNFDYEDNASAIFNKISENKRQELISYFLNDKTINSILIKNVKLFNDGIHLNFDGHIQMANRVYMEIKNAEDK